jgi:Protein of unknown function (DUF2442)
MFHPIVRITSCQIVGPYRLRIGFDDGSEQTIDFKAILAGRIYEPLLSLDLFNQVKIDPEVATLIWPNGADFDPATLHDWPVHEPLWREKANQWRQAHAVSFGG